MVNLQDSQPASIPQPYWQTAAARLLERRQSRPSAPTFRGAGLAIQSYVGREFIIAGPAETGKTFASLWLLDSLLRANPGAKATLARKLQTSIYSTVIITWERVQAIRASMGDAGIDTYGGTRPQIYSYPNGSRLWVGGMDNPQRILSGERDFIFINQAEEFTLEDWEVCHTRTTGRGGVVAHPMTFGDCNPSSEDHWILKRETLKLFHSKHEDNPSLFTASGAITAQGVRTMQTLDSLTGVRKKRLRHGQWVGAEGLFFEHFDPEDGRVVIDPLDFVPSDWPLWGALDWGHVHPLAFGLFTEDNDGNVHLIFEHVQNKWLIPYHCRAIREGLRRLNLRPDRIEQIVAGHDVFQTQGGSNVDDLKTKADQFKESRDPQTRQPNGFELSYANIDRAQGAAELLLRLGNPDPALRIEPSLRIWNTCRRTIAAMSRMVHDPLDPEKIKKINADLNGEGGDDEVDMLRYGVMLRQGANKPDSMDSPLGRALTQESWR